MDDDKLASNFYASDFSVGSETSIPMTGELMSLPPEPYSDDGGVQDYAPVPLAMSMGPAEPYPGEAGLPYVLQAPPPKPKNYKALARARIIDLLSPNGAPRRIRQSLTMVDETTGSGKAIITIGKDIKQRKFEVPISIKSSEIHVGKARDIVSDERYEIGSESLFESPDQVIIFKELGNTYDKYLHYFSGRVTDDKVEALTKRYPSLTDSEARLFLNQQFEDSKNLVYKAVDVVREHKNKILLVGGIGVVFVGLYVKNKFTGKPEAVE